MDNSRQQRGRRHTTRWSVRVADRVARWTIAIGGVGTILAVSFVAIFLAWVVMPLFRGASADFEGQERPVRTGRKLCHLGVDAYGQMAWTCDVAGVARSYRLTTGNLLSESRLFPEREPSAASFSLRDGQAIFGFPDGTIRIGKLDFATEFLDAARLPAALRNATPGHVAEHRGGVVEFTDERQWRWQRLVFEAEPALPLKPPGRVHRVDASFGSHGRIFVALDEHFKLHIGKVVRRKNLLTGKTTAKLQEGVVDVPARNGRLPDHLALTGLGDAAVVAWSDGTALRFNVRSIRNPVLVEEIDLTPESDARLTALAFLIGKTSLVTGDSQGRVRVWFRIKPDNATTSDGARLVMGHDLPAARSAVVGLTASPRSRMLAASYADGSVRLFHATSEQLLLDLHAPSTDTPTPFLAIGPKEDRIVAASDDRFDVWSIDVRHPETTMSSVFGKVWYEGYTAPEHVWQSSSGSDDFEPKYGLMPLVFGTVKATLYSLLLAVPLAWLAAVYTSEFMTARARRVVKPTIEMMASLPSVVLGFLAALVFAPWVERVLPEMLAATFTVPYGILLGAYLWQFLPSHAAARFARLRIYAVPIAIAAGICSAWQFGPLLERWMFAGDWKAWLDGQIGTGTGAWCFISLPASSLATVWCVARYVTPRLRDRYGRWNMTLFASVDLVKFLVASLLALALAYAAALALEAVVGDPRGVMIGTYIQRNALVVGLVMGFAVIPIIYTLSDDALSAVPDTLRAGSLATGATRWQTAIRIVVPTAMSGLFSALMVGLGRAVGETMIVLMAAGNTPIMDWNVFNGFRTLSANIAVELPEAVVGSTHYRMLFVAALVLFAMTFVINTIAEIVRIRFRKKAVEL